MSGAPSKAKLAVQVFAAGMILLLGIGAYAVLMKGDDAPPMPVDVGMASAANIDPSLLPPPPGTDLGSPSAVPAGVTAPGPDAATPANGAPIATAPTAMASEPAPAPLSVTPPTQSPFTAAVAQSECTGLSDHLCELNELNKRTEHARAELDLLQTQEQINALKGDVQQGQAGTDRLPVLVGLSGTPGHYVAEFAVGARVFSARPGDWVTADWRLEKILANGVVVRRGNGRETHTMMMGGEVEERAAASSATANYPTTRPGAGGP